MVGPVIMPDKRLFGSLNWDHQSKAVCLGLSLVKDYQWCIIMSWSLFLSITCNTRKKIWVVTHRRTIIKVKWKIWNFFIYNSFFYYYMTNNEFYHSMVHGCFTTDCFTFTCTKIHDICFYSYHVYDRSFLVVSHWTTTKGSASTYITRNVFDKNAKETSTWKRKFSSVCLFVLVCDSGKKIILL